MMIIRPSMAVLNRSEAQAMGRHERQPEKNSPVYESQEAGHDTALIRRRKRMIRNKLRTLQCKGNNCASIKIL
jgi:hypothetical protein